LEEFIKIGQRLKSAIITLSDGDSKLDKSIGQMLDGIISMKTLEDYKQKFDQTKTFGTTEYISLDKTTYFLTNRRLAKASILKLYTAATSKFDNRVWSEILEAKRKETGKVIDAQIEARKIAADAAEAKKKADAEEEARKKAEALAEARRQAEAKRLAEDCPEFSTVEHIREFESSLKKAQLDSTKTRMMFPHLNKTWYMPPESKEQLLNPGEGDYGAPFITIKMDRGNKQIEGNKIRCPYIATMRSFKTKDSKLVNFYMTFFK
jgi:hypothetical protein